MCKTIRAYRVEKRNGGLVSSEKGRAKLILNEKKQKNILSIIHMRIQIVVENHGKWIKNGGTMLLRL